MSVFRGESRVGWLDKITFATTICGEGDFVKKGSFDTFSFDLVIAFGILLGKFFIYFQQRFCRIPP